MSVLLGLVAAATCGSSDFLAGLASRRLPRIIRGERWSAAQKAGLVTALLATFMVSLGSA